MIFPLSIIFFLCLNFRRSGSVVYLHSRKIKFLNPAGGTIPHVDVQLVLDTQTMQETSSVKENCEDIRFRTKNKYNIKYIIESGCGTNHTTFILRLVNFGPELEIEMVYGSQESSVLEGAEYWDGFFVLFQRGHECKGSWSLFEDLDNGFVIGSGQFGQVHTKEHSHQFAGLTSTGTLYTTKLEQSSPYDYIGNGAHQHSFTGDQKSSENIFPRHLPVRFCRSRSLELYTGQFVLVSNYSSSFDDLQAMSESGWRVASEFESMFFMGTPHNSSVLMVPGGGEHSHEFDIEFGASSTYSYTRKGTSTWLSDNAHKHPKYSGTSGVEENVPPHINVMVFESLFDAAELQQNMAIAVSSLPPLGYVLVEEVQGSFLRGTTNKFSVGAYAGTDEHSHEIAGFSCEETTDPKLQMHRRSYGGVTTVSGDHLHTISALTTSPGSNMPPLYTEVIFATRQVSIFPYELEKVINEEQIIDDDETDNDNDNDDDDDDDSSGGGGSGNKLDLKTQRMIGMLVGVVGIVLCVLLCVGGVSLIAFVAVLLRKIQKDSKDLKKFHEIKDVDVILQEQALEESESGRNIARLSINNKLFEVNYDDVRVVEKLGSGGSMSVVFRCEWRNMVVAFKCFKTEDIMDSQKKFNDFENEVSILASVSHLYGATLRPPRVGIIMEYCSNLDVKEFLKNNPKFPIKDRVRILSERSNVLITDNYESRLMDFGLSRVLANCDKTKTRRVGTSHYMAPEMTTGADYDSKIDVFSFGICVCEIITGDFAPYGKLFNVELRVASEPDFRPKVDARFFKNLPWLAALMESCWTHLPSIRPDFDAIVGIFSRNVAGQELEKCKLPSRKDVEQFEQKKSMFYRARSMEGQVDADTMKEIVREKDAKIKALQHEVWKLKKRVKDLESSASSVIK